MNSRSTRHSLGVSLPVVVPDVFDQPSLWRIEAAECLGLGGDDLIAAMSPGPAFPAALRSLHSALPAAVRVIVDLGAGTGGASEWLRTATGATVYAVEPAAGARQTAIQAFPALHVIEGSADAVALPDAVADAVLLSGVISLMDDIDPVIAEVDRLLAPGGRAAIADLFSADGSTWASAPNVFRSVERITEVLDRSGFTTLTVGCGDPVPDAAWAAAARAVDEWIHAHCTGREGFDEWNADREHLRQLIASGAVVGGCLVAERHTTAEDHRAHHID